jgi:hypothetical protein
LAGVTLAPLLPVIAACGLVTSDPEPQGAGGSAGMGGSAGQSSDPPACTAFERAGAAVAIAEGSNPQLTKSGSEVHVVFETGGALRAAHWQDPWSSALEAPAAAIASVAISGSSGFVVSRESSSNSPVVLHPGDWSSAAAPCLQLTRLGDDPDSLLQIGDCSSSGAGLSANALIRGETAGTDAYLLVYGPGSTSRLAWWAPGSSLLESDYVACSTSGFGVAGWHSAEAGFVAAIANGSPFGACSGEAGPADRLQLVRASPDSGALALALSDELLFHSPIINVTVAPRSDGGAWLVVMLREGDEQTSLHAVSVNGEQLVNEPPVPLVQQSGMAHPALAALGDRAVLVSVAASGALELTLLDGATTSATSPHHVEPAQAVRASVVGSPTEDAILAAWQDSTGTVRAARFDCVF